MLSTTLFSHSISPVYAADFEIIPATKTNNLGQDVDCVAGSNTGVECQKWTVWDRYNKKTKAYSGDLGAQFATGIFSRDGVLDYVVYIIRFISQMGLVIGAWMIIYTGYKYASAVFSGKTPSTDMIRNALGGILVVIFSYAIIRILTSAFL